MNTDPQFPQTAGSPRSEDPAQGAADGHRQARSAGHAGDAPAAPGAPGFPGAALRDWLNHRVKLGVPVWAVVIAFAVLIVIALD